MLNFIKNISPTEIALIVVILILFFGSKAIVNIGRTGGETLRELKNVKKEFTEALKGGESKSENS